MPIHTQTPMFVFSHMTLLYNTPRQTLITLSHINNSEWMQDEALLFQQAIKIEDFINTDKNAISLSKGETEKGRSVLLQRCLE